MAPLHETKGDFGLQRLRSSDTSYLRGATQALGGDPEPIVVATGPASVTNTSAVGASEVWGLGVTMPAVPEVVWVLVSARPTVQSNAVFSPVNLFFLTQADVTDTDLIAGPYLAQLGATATFTPGAAGTHNIVGPTLGADSLWVPVDPAATSNGWTPGISATAGTTGPGIAAWRADMRQVIFLGYPVNYWDTGKIWGNMARRGS